jgi:hypothetical protein
MIFSKAFAWAHPVCAALRGARPSVRQMSTAQYVGLGWGDLAGQELKGCLAARLMQGGWARGEVA